MVSHSTIVNNQKSIILWRNGKPSLYCTHKHDDRWLVENGKWVLQLNGLVGLIIATGTTLVFDKITLVEKDGYYEDVLERARLEESNE